MDSLPQWLNDSLKEIDHPLFKNVIKAEVDVKPMGDGQIVVISDIKRVTLTLVTTNGDKREVKAIVKVEPPEGPGKAMASDTGAFSTEVMMYSSTLKLMESVLSESNDKNNIWPDCYLAKENKFVFQDLCEEGYKIVPTYVFLDVDHTLLVMAGLGKFHGLSLVLKQRYPEKMNHYGMPFIAKHNPGLDKVQKKTLDDLNNAIRSWGPEWATVPDRLENYFGTPSKTFKELWNSTRGPWDVLNHGDFSMRNMLFHYKEGSEKPDIVKFIDFQMCHTSNFAFDLALLLYSSLLPSVRDENMDHFLKCYTESFVRTCKEHGFCGSLPTLQDVQQALKSVHCFSNVIALFQLPFFIQSNQQDVQKRADEYMESYTADENSSEAKAVPSFVDFSNQATVDLLQSELRRCMKENYF